MTEEKSKNEYREDFVNFMVEKSQKKEENTPTNTADVDHKEVENILERIKKDIQEKK